jgi:hypothetical protein
MAQRKSEIDKNFVIKAAVYIGAGLLAYRLYRNIFGASSNQQTAADAINCGNIWNSGQLSRSRESYFADADEIYTAIQGTGLFVSWYEDDAKIEEVLKRANNDADVSALICAFGNRKPSILSPAEALPSWITSYLDTGNKDRVNQYYASKGITYRW